jgi:hypothetical protein
VGLKGKGHGEVLRLGSRLLFFPLSLATSLPPLPSLRLLHSPTWANGSDGPPDEPSTRTVTETCPPRRSPGPSIVFSVAASGEAACARAIAMEPACTMTWAELT